MLKSRSCCFRSGSCLAEKAFEVASLSYDEGKATLNALLARSLSTPLTVVDSLEYQPLSLTLEKLKTMAVQQRPDLSGAKMQSISLRTRQAAAAAAYVPDLNIGVFRQRLRDGASEDDFWLR